MYLYLNPGTAIVVIGHDLNPGAVFVIIGGALHPCAVVVVPDRRITVGQQQVRALGRVAGAWIVAAKVGVGRAASRAVAPEPHGACAAVLRICLDDVRQVDAHPARAGFHLDAGDLCQHGLPVIKSGLVAVPYGQGRGVRGGDVDFQYGGCDGQRLLVLPQLPAQIGEIHAERSVGGVVKVVAATGAGPA